jgi:hypothetical protein
MLFNLAPYYLDSFHTQAQQVQIFDERAFFAQGVIEISCVDNVLPIRRFPSLRKQANGPVTKFEREFFV